MNYALSYGWESNFSFDGVEKKFVEQFGPVIETPLTPEQEKLARVGMEKFEQARLASMKQYEKDGLPPFMRPATPPPPTVEGPPVDAQA